MALMEAFDIPRGMTHEVLARTFSAYLQGALAFENSLDDSGQLRKGPYKKEGRDTDWQLDDTNDFWLYIRDDKAILICRYARQERIAAAAIALFKARFLEDVEADFVPCMSIVVAKRSNHYLAYVDGRPNIWATGKSAYEAVGDLIMHHKDVTGIKIDNQT
ncbi:MAG TPA: hypothetical protein VN495_01615 [Candidatus Paceibacterota bacterium]|nr:hypothetical protein [Candidatus Paceibacterota bacterium]